MPPKKSKKVNEASKKNVQKKKERIIDDKTFGLKNKNKSKKVQALIHSVQKTVHNSGDRKQRQLDEKRKMAKANAKAKKKAMEDERNALFGEALLAVKKKTSTKMKSDDVAKGRDHEDGKEKSGTSRAMKMMFQMDAKEMEDALTSDPNYVRTIEDDVEQQRQKKLDDLKAKGIKGTPVTEESFKLWQERKRKAKEDAARKLVETEMRKRKGGKGLSVLSGRDLFAYKRDLFKDDEEAGDIKGGFRNDNDADLEEVAEKVQSNLFLEGDDDDLDDLDDLDDSDDD